MDVLHSEPGPCTGACLMSSDSGNQVVCIKVEDIAGLKLEGDPGSTTSLIQTEPSVSCVSLCISCLAHCTDIQNFLSISVFSVCIKFYNVDWIC